VQNKFIFNIIGTHNEYDNINALEIWNWTILSTEKEYQKALARLDGTYLIS